MKVQFRITGLASLLFAAAAQAYEAPVKVGGWEISAEPGLHRCSMQRFYRAKAVGIEGLIVVYDADKDGLLLFWSTDSMSYLPAEGRLDLDLRFRDGALIDESWGNQTFHYKKVSNARVFTGAFLEPEKSRRLLSDLARHAEIGLFLGPVLQTAFPLGPASAVEKLTECAIKGALSQ